jgi:aconitate hydratase
MPGAGGWGEGRPSSPGNVVAVRDVEGEEIYQAYIGSSANPGYRDFAVVAEMVRGRRVHPRVSFDVNPVSRQQLETLAREGLLAELIRAGARLHQAGCNGCIGMGQAPATGRNSLRTTPRNFPGRSGTREDSVFLCSPETAAASALTGRITDPRDLEIRCPQVKIPERFPVNTEMFVAPLPPEQARGVELTKGPNIASLPEMEPLPDRLELPVLLKVGDGISTDEILPAGARVLPYRSNIPEISRFVKAVDRATRNAKSLLQRMRDRRRRNYGRDRAAARGATPPGLRMVLAKRPSLAKPGQLRCSPRHLRVRSAVLGSATRWS